MPAQRIIPENLIPEIITYYLQVKSLKECSNKFGYKPETIWNTLKRNNVDTKRDHKFTGEKIRKFQINPNLFEEINSRDTAYITGLLHSDGCVSTKGNQIRFKSTDLDFLQQVSDKIYKNKPIYIEKQINENHKPTGSIIISHDKIYQDAIKHGCCISKSYNLKFPTTIADDFIGDYLRGFFDGDGCIYVRNTFKYKPAQVSIIATKSWSEGCQFWLNQNSIESKIYQDKRHDTRIAVLVVNIPEYIERFYNLIYFELDNQLYLKRKFDYFSDYILFRKMFNYN